MAKPRAADFRLGVLDQSPIPEGSSSGVGLRNTIELAQLSDAVGYDRYWLAEHHGSPALACTAPEVLIGPVASATSRIRVGSGGIMLPHYSPLKVAENFHMLTSLYGDRIDLGIGRAAGTTPAFSFALQRDKRQRLPDDFRDQLDELLGYFGVVETSDKNSPAKFASPECFLLGSSPQSAMWAAELGLPYVFADFINSDGAEIVDYYRRAFQPSKVLAKPHVVVASWTVCADTDEEAERQSLSMQMMMRHLAQGRLIPVPSIEKAEKYLADDFRHAGLYPQRRRITGSPQTVRAGLEQLAHEYGGPDEILLVNILYDHAARMRSYELVAREFGLNAHAQATVREAVAS